MKAKLIKDISATDYHADKASPTNLGGAVSKSLLWDFNQSPFKWRWGRKQGSTPAMELGTLVHALCFTPSEVVKSYVVSPYDSFRTNEAKAWREDMKAEGKSVITQEVMDQANDIADNIINTETLHHLGEKDFEVAVEADWYGTKVKGMIDIVPTYGNLLVDLKTTSSIGSLDAITRLIINRGYHWQAAMYLDLYNAATGQNRTEFHFLFVEVDSPYEWAWVNLSENLIAKGREEYMNALAKWNRCHRENYWPKAIEGNPTIENPIWNK